MTIQELGTIMQSGHRCKDSLFSTIIFLEWFVNGSNCFMTKRYSFVDIQALILYRLQKVMVSKAKVFAKREELQGALKEMLDHKGAYLLEVMVGKENNVFPMVPQGCSVAEIRLK